MEHLTRSCISCRGRSAKQELVRFVAEGGALVWDRKQDHPGRGAYLHTKETCLIKGTEPAKWERALKVERGKIEPMSITRAIREVRNEREVN